MMAWRPLYAAFWWLLPKALGSAHPDLRAEAVCYFQPADNWISPATCPSDAPSQGGENERDPSQSGAWFRSDICHEVGPDEICAFTQPSFNGGQGIALVTTADILAEMVAVLPILNRPDSEEAAPEEGSSTAYREEQIPGKGLGLVATRYVKEYEVFLKRMPTLMVDETAFKRLGRARLTELVTQAIDDLPGPRRAEYLDLTTHAEVETHGERVYEIFIKNNFDTPIDGISVFYSVFPKVSRLNHACRANSMYAFDASTLSQSVLAARGIETGEELTVGYFDTIQTRSRRQMLARHGWGFGCSCPHCSASAGESARSDQRVEQIQALLRDLDDYSPASTATPDKAGLLVRLLEEEGLVTRMVEAHYRVAVEWNGVGRVEDAVKAAEMCIEGGKVLGSSVGPFVDSMRELVRDPAAHWTWRFRLGHAWHATP